MSEALSSAEARALQLASLDRAGSSKASQYGYPNRPLREEVLQEFKNRGDTHAVISRNRYGALVLNTSGLMFLDIDSVERPASEKPGFFASLFGGSKKSAVKEQPPVTPLSMIEKWSWDHPSWGIRVYKTAAGYRLAVTHQSFDSAEGVDQGVFSELKVDPLYQRLCKNQKSFRARLTPKPWRIGVLTPSVRWPFEDSEQQSVFDNWQREYVAASEGFAVCEFVKSLGKPSVLPEFAELIALHDRQTKANSKLPLA